LSLASKTDYWVVFGFGPGGVSSTIIGSGNNEVAGCAALYGGDVEGSEEKFNDEENSEINEGTKANEESEHKDSEEKKADDEEKSTDDEEKPKRW